MTGLSHRAGCLILTRHEITTFIGALLAPAGFPGRPQKRVSDDACTLSQLTTEIRRQRNELLVQQARENPFFHLYFAQEKLPYTMGEVALYDGRALITMSSGSGYDLRTDHRESCITHPFVLRAYKQFYMNTVVARLADTQTESLNQLEELVRRCEKMIREGQKGNAGNEQEKLSGQ